jgi:hypothetical protein
MDPMPKGTLPITRPRLDKPIKYNYTQPAGENEGFCRGPLT